MGPSSSSSGSVSGLPPVQSGIPAGGHIEALPASAGSMTRPNWPSYSTGGSGYTFQPARKYGGGSYGGGCSSGGCSSGGGSYSTSPAAVPSYGGSSYSGGWTGGSSGYNPVISTGGVSTLPASVSGSGASVGFSTLPASVSSGYRSGYVGGCGSAGSSYGTMIGSLMPSSPCAARSSYMRRQTRPWVGGWGGKIQMTKPAPVMSTGIISSSIPSSSSSISSSSSSSSSSGCGSCGK